MLLAVHCPARWELLSCSDSFEVSSATDLRRSETARSKIAISPEKISNFGTHSRKLSQRTAFRILRQRHHLFGHGSVCPEGERANGDQANPLSPGRGNRVK